MLTNRSQQGEMVMKDFQQPEKGVPTMLDTTDHPLYEVPAVIYEGVITTRAGSPTGSADDSRAVDPADLFGK